MKWLIRPITPNGSTPFDAILGGMVLGLWGYTFWKWIHG